MPSTTADTSIFTPATSFTAEPDPNLDPFNLNRFVKAQDENDIFNRVLATIREGRRKPQPATWIWFVFPQMDKCMTRERRPRDRHRDVWPRGHALTGLNEARAYLRHPILGPRIREAAQALLDSPFSDKFSIMDNMFYDVDRLHSSMTIFRQATRYPICIHQSKHHFHENYVFRRVLDRYFADFLNSDDEDDLLDQNHQELMKQCRGRRHVPTMNRLDAMELEAIERRLEKGEGCVCGRTKEELQLLDKASKSKIVTIGTHHEFGRMRKIRETGVLMDLTGQNPRQAST